MTFQELKKKAYQEGLHDTYVDQFIGDNANFFINSIMETGEHETLTPKQRSILQEHYFRGVKSGL